MTQPTSTLPAAAARIRKDLRLLSLTPAERNRCQGKWFLTALDFARRAARCLNLHREVLRDVPYGPEDIHAQRERVMELEAAVLTLQRLSKQAQDTLLKERATLYGMATGVLRAVAHECSRPFPRPPGGTELASSLKLLRREFDRRAKKISATRRTRAARRATPEPSPPTPPALQPGGIRQA